ncbi:MAG: YqaA family protein [Candidatus Firestonebacteria bacterium]
MDLKTKMKSPFVLLRMLYDWTILWSQSKKAPFALFGIAFSESSFFPIPPDVLLIPMVVGQRNKWFKYALICTIGSVLGGLFGYLIGWGLYETVGKAIVNFYNMQEVVKIVGTKYAENAFITVFTAAFTPIPYKAITITAGVFFISLKTLIVASIIGRGARFFLVAGILKIYGKKLQDSIEKYFNIFSTIFIVLLIGGIIILKYFF